MQIPRQLITQRSCPLPENTHKLPSLLGKECSQTEPTIKHSRCFDFRCQRIRPARPLILLRHRIEASPTYVGLYTLDCHLFFRPISSSKDHRADKNGAYSNLGPMRVRFIHRCACEPNNKSRFYFRKIMNANCHRPMAPTQFAAARPMNRSDKSEAPEHIYPTSPAGAA